MKGKDNILMNLMYDKKISIELCDNNSGYSSARCNNSNRCPGSNNGNCYPNDVWSGTVNGSSNAYNYELWNGGWNQNNNNRTFAFSVRCVTDFLEQNENTKLEGEIKIQERKYFSKHCLDVALNLWAQRSAVTPSHPVAFSFSSKSSRTKTRISKDLLLGKSKISASPQSSVGLSARPQRSAVTPSHPVAFSFSSKSSRTKTRISKDLLFFVF